MKKEITAPKIRKYPPTLNVDDSDLPAIKEWQVGKTYECLVKMKQVSCRVSQGDSMMDGPESNSKKKIMHASFEIMDIEPMKDDQAEVDENYFDEKKKKVNRLKEMAEAED